jgi:DNA-directed RNA polymerase beta subunit
MFDIIYNVSSAKAWLDVARDFLEEAKKDDEKKIQSSGREEKFAKPNVKYTRGKKPGNYDKLDERGIIRKDEYVTSDDIIIGKVLPLKNKFDENGHQLYKDCSTSL